MAQTTLMPMFPLTLLPLPGELVPLHIFEPRYKELLRDAEVTDTMFGIYFSHEINKSKLGSLVKLESILQRYENGELDIVVRCEDIFNLDILYRTFKDRPYPGGDIVMWNVGNDQPAGGPLVELFSQYRALRTTHRVSPISVFQMATELNLDFSDRYKFLIAEPDKKEIILLNRLKFLIHALQLELKSKDVFHLN
jgi:Lon protease-like protein